MSGPHETPDGAFGKARHAARHLTIDLTPLRGSKDFRRLWIAEVVTITGSEATALALLIYVTLLTGSAAAVGLMGLVEFLCLVAGTIVGGPLIDRYDRRSILLTTQLAMSLSAAVLLATALMGEPPLPLIYLAAGFVSFFGGIDAPTRSAVMPNLVRPDQIPAATALTTAMYSIAWIVGPLIAGLLVAIAGVGAVFAFDLASFILSLILLLRLRRLPPQHTPGEGIRNIWAELRQGLAYLRGRKVLQSTFSIDLIAMIFGLPEAVLTFLAIERFGSEAIAGVMLTAMAGGALIASLTSGWVSRVRHQGRAVIWAVVVWGAGITAFGFVERHLWLALVFLAIAGAADTISAVFRGTILQATVPDALRGRLSSVHFLVVAGGPRLGNLEAGLVAAVTSPAIAVISGGVITIAGALLNGLLVPEFRRYHAGEET
ncbi:MAG: MFS transporter [Actinomycetota bacterium]